MKIFDAKDTRRCYRLSGKKFFTTVSCLRKKEGNDMSGRFIVFQSRRKNTVESERELQKNGTIFVEM